MIGVERGHLRFVDLDLLPELLLPRGSFDLSLGNERLLAGIVAALVAWLTKSVVITIIAGMAVLLILQALAG